MSEILKKAYKTIADNAFNDAYKAIESDNDLFSYYNGFLYGMRVTSEDIEVVKYIQGKIDKLDKAFKSIK